MVLTAVPVIDISAYRGGDAAARRRARGRGRPDLPRDRLHGDLRARRRPRLIEAVESVSRAFFDLPLEEKMRTVRPAPDVTRGYMPIEGRGAGAQPRRQCAGRPEREPDDRPGRYRRRGLLHRAEAGRHFVPNLWPERPAGCANLRALLPRDGCAGDRSDAPLRPGARPAREILRFERRPLDQPAAGAQLSGAGRDAGAGPAPRRRAQRLWQPHHPKTEERPGGLQVLGKDGDWLDVPHGPAASSSTSATCWRAGPTTAGSRPCTGSSTRRPIVSPRAGGSRWCSSRTRTTTRWWLACRAAPMPQTHRNMHRRTSGGHLREKFVATQQAYA